MINTDKVRLMAELNLFEKAKGHEALKLRNSVRHLRGAERIKNILYGIVACLLIVFIIVISKYDEILEIYHNIGLTMSIAALAFCMVIFVVAYCIYSRHMILRKYSKYEGILWKYNYKKRKLRDVLFDEDMPDGNNIEVNTAK